MQCSYLVTDTLTTRPRPCLNLAVRQVERQWVCTIHAKKLLQEKRAKTLQKLPKNLKKS